MKQLQKEILTAVLMGMVVPGILLSALARGETRPTVPEEETVPPSAETRAQPTPVRIPVLFSDDTVREVDLEDYLCGVVLAEMPVSFESEAQKAQAVVARTYALRRFLGGTKHPEGAVCTDPNCCQGYLSPEDFQEKGGTEDGIEKIRHAVTETAGQVLTYEGDLIEATYFSCSGGMTEDAQAVWGSDVPYLQAVPSPGEEYAAHYSDTFVFSREEFCSSLGLEDPGKENFRIGEAIRTEGGGIASLGVCSEVFTGPQLRSLLKLPSTDLSIDSNGETVTVVTYGFGHRVGMSQYGADAMAVGGSSYDQILDYYYRGTALVQYPEDVDKAEKGG